MMITQDILKEQLLYDPLTGLFTFRNKKGGMPAGSVAGYVQKDGYIAISVNGVQYKAHRLAWLYSYGRFPEYYLDHINMRKDDNRIDNLRIATRSQNHMNRKAYVNNKLGTKGVHLCGKKFRSLIKKDGKQICLGIYETIDEAKDAYRNASELMHGEFSRIS